MTMRAGLVVAVVAAAWPAIGVGLAAAQTDDSVDEAARERARELYRRGRALYEQGRAEEALEILRQSHEIFPKWTISNGMALCEDSLGHPEEALRLYERSIAEGGSAIPEDQRRQLEQRIGELRRTLNLVWLTLTTVPEGARAEFDAEPLGTTPFAGNVPAGSHALRIVLDGYETAERSLSLAVGEARAVEVALIARAPVAPTAPETGRLTVSTDGSGKPLYIDGERVAMTPVEDLVVPAGEHVLRVEGDDSFWEERVGVPAAETVRIAITFGAGGVHQGWFWGVAATAVATGIGSAAAGGYAWSLHDEYQGASPARQDEIRPSLETTLDVADTLLGVAGAATLGALLLLFFTDFSEEPAGAITVGGPAQGGNDATAIAVPLDF